MSTATRRDFLTKAGVAGLGAVLVGSAAACTTSTRDTGESAMPTGEATVHGATENTEGLTPEQAMAKLTEGNARFVAMSDTDPNLSSERLLAVSKGQHPFAAVLGCVDSRVPPELVFDRGLGDLFDARVAGAIAEDGVVGSIEFGVEEFDIPLIVVLGHSSCGAVKATVKAVTTGETTLPGKIGAVAGPIIPAVKAVQAKGVTGDAVIPAVVEEVVRESMAVLEASPVLTEKLESGALKIVGAVYELPTGKVTFLA